VERVTARFAAVAVKANPSAFVVVLGDWWIEVASF
jgi:hypothetical protein